MGGSPADINIASIFDTDYITPSIIYSYANGKIWIEKISSRQYAPYQGADEKRPDKELFVP